jgi:ubiquinone/menaquinone biosynthesis C-methylase UbiE
MNDMALRTIDYDDRQHAVYSQARAIAPEMLAQWMDVFNGVLPPRRPLPILDLGSGTGRFAPALAERFGGPVFGVEPSANMRRVAETTAQSANLRYLAGDAGAIPLDDGAVDAVLMFLSFHHFPDRAAAVREIVRVLRPGGRVLLRGVFSDRPASDWWLGFFPRLAEINAQMFPTLDEVTRVFSAAGLRPLDLIAVSEHYAANTVEAVERLRLKGISTFEHLTETELAEGFARIDRAVAAGELNVPPRGPSDLLVLG